MLCGRRPHQMFQDQLWGPLTARRKSRSFKQLPCLLQPLPALTGSELPSPRAFSFGSIPSLSIPLPAHPPPAAGPFARPSIQGAPCLSVTGRRAFTLHPSGNEALAIYRAGMAFMDSPFPLAEITHSVFRSCTQKP